MLALSFAVFMLSSLASGNTGRLTSAVKGFFTPAMPKLIISDAQYEYKINPLGQRDVTEFRAFLSTSYEDNTGITVLATDNPSSAGTSGQTPFARQLSKIGYTPKNLTVKQAFEQSVNFATPPTGMEVYMFFLDEVNTSFSLVDINTFTPDKDGLCYVLIDALWETQKSWQRNRSGLYCFTVTFDRPSIFTINTELIDPGELLVFYAEYLMPGEPVSVQSSLPLNLQFEPYGRRHMVALAPISYDIRPGS